MPDLIKTLDEKIKSFGADWTKYSVVGSFVLYVFGYLSLRFHLTTFGVSTDLAVLDERYVFSGARFLVYCISSLPSIAILALPLAAVGWALARLAPAGLRRFLRDRLGSPAVLTLGGIAFSVLAIQLVMRQSFYFSDLLLAARLPAQPAWLVRLLLDDEMMPLYFAVLVALTIVSFSALWFGKSATPSATLRAGRGLLWLLAVLELLLLPINFGILVVDQSVPRVSAIGDQPLKEAEAAWLIWEGKDDFTYLFLGAEPRRRTLVSVPRSDVKRIEVVGFDRILPRLFGQEVGK